MNWWSRVISGFDRSFDRILTSMAVFAAVILLFVMVSISGEVTLRYIEGRSRVWVLEVSQYAMLFITFLTAAWTLSKRGHVRIDVVIEQFKPRAKAMINVVTSLLATLVSLVITWFGVTVTWECYQQNLIYPTVLRPPYCVLVAIIPVGFFFLFIQSLRNTRDYVNELKALPDKE